jgi:hypothetical protein
MRTLFVVFDASLGGQEVVEYSPVQASRARHWQDSFEFHQRVRKPSPTPQR